MSTYDIFIYKKNVLDVIANQFHITIDMIYFNTYKHRNFYYCYEKESFENLELPEKADC